MIEVQFNAFHKRTGGLRRCHRGNSKASFPVRSDRRVASERTVLHQPQRELLMPSRMACDKISYMLGDGGPFDVAASLDFKGDIL
jgi:hypothetical protein